LCFYVVHALSPFFGGHLLLRTRWSDAKRIVSRSIVFNYWNLRANVLNFAFNFPCEFHAGSPFTKWHRPYLRLSNKWRKKMCVCVHFFPSLAFTNLLALQFFLLIFHRCALRGQSGVVVRTVRQALWDFKAFASTKIPAKIEARAAREGYPMRNCTHMP
jgi:hypothetical protein